jgi:4-hydroxybenzoate polyprenyltransferase
MVSSSSLKLLRLPFSFFLMPITLFAYYAAGPLDPVRAAAAFVVLHLFVYTASNGFNSFYDRDDGPIGGIRRPPAVTPDLLPLALVLDAVGLALSFIVHPLFAAAILVYGLCSKAYSWDRIRLKRLPVTGWLGTALVQGAFTFLAVAVFCAAGPPRPPGPRLLLAALACSLFLGAVYPLTQVYQHEADAARGDLTMSRLLGVRGTFRFSGAFILLAGAAFGAWFMLFGTPLRLATFALSQLPTLVYFTLWWARVARRPGAADYGSALRMNVIASGLMNAWFIAALAAGG